MPHNHRGQKRDRRQERKNWCRHILDLARLRGDKRPAQTILEEHVTRSEIIREAIRDAFTGAHRDKERAEVVALQDYPKAGIYKAEVLSQARSYVHPKLLPT
jgi:hypothetical protein